MTLGKIELSERPNAYLRIQKYEIIDQLNELDRDVYKKLKSSEFRDKFKRIKALVNNL